MKKYLNILLVLSVAGVAFSGYLSGLKLLTNQCAFGETCPTFLGYPSCWFGFVLFLAMFVLIVIAREKRSTYFKMMNSVAIVAFLGDFFAGSFVYQEVNDWIVAGGMPHYTLGLPTCAYGLIFYLLIFFITAKALSKKELAKAGIK